jgi:hypothetical protein
MNFFGIDCVHLLWVIAVVEVIGLLLVIAALLGMFNNRFDN